MSGPYFQKHRWPDFAYQGQRYGLNHLDEYIFSVDDSQAVTRQIVATFEDHCFTPEWEAGDDTGFPIVMAKFCTLGRAPLRCGSEVTPAERSLALLPVVWSPLSA